MMVADPITDLAQSVCERHRYTLVRACDAGAFKKTFHIKDGDRDLALKLVVGAIDPTRVEREVKALQACSHPNISRLLQVDRVNYQAGSLVYFVEEYFSGGTLGARIEDGTILDLAEGKRLALSLGAALSHLAARNIVHRDIKPENIMYRADGTAVLIDLGIARHLDASSLTQSWLAQGPGTPAYAAPEQLLNEKFLIDWRTDQFGLGITLSMAMLGMHPYSGTRLLDHVVERVSRREPPVDVFLSRARSSHLDVLTKMVELWPVKRYARPEHLIDAWQNVGVLA